MTSILGISAFYHDSAAALVVDGEIIAAAQEERFTRKKHDSAFPEQAIRFCLERGKIAQKDLDYIVFYDKPVLKFDRLFETYLATAPRGFKQFKKSFPIWVGEKLFLRSKIRSHFPDAAKAAFAFMEHHESHAASAFFPSPFKDAAILTLDGVGEWATSTYGIGRGNKISLDAEIRFPHSIGLLYSAFTHYCGFKVNSGEYKLMGLAPYGKPLYRQQIVDHLIDIKEDGSFWLDTSYLGYCHGLEMTNQRFDALFGGPRRLSESQLEQRHMDLAASIQAVTEEIVLRAASHLHRRYGSDNLVMAGGVALNCVANGKVLREGPFKNIWIQPAAGDAGGSLGAALFVWHQLLDGARQTTGRDFQKGSFLGPEYADDVIEAKLTAQDVTFQKFSNDTDLLDSVAQSLAAGKIVGWFQGRVEFGPRALGGRSILGDPRAKDMQSRMNLKIKFRESFRPFAPAVLNEEKHHWFDIAEQHENPYMLIVANVKREHQVALSVSDNARMQGDPNLLNRVNVVRSDVPAVTHIDLSARIQTIGAEGNPRFRALLRRFHKLTGCPILINTSFNIRGEPIVCSPEDALRCFAATEMDLLVLGNCVVSQSSKKAILGEKSQQEYIAKFELD